MLSDSKPDEIVVQAVDELKARFGQDADLLQSKLNYSIEHFFKRCKVDPCSSASNHPGVSK